ncbi:type II toxin-antitoxin system HipA family toxin [Aliidiomarina minuta]|uniref:Type II toxin-antitoxin system HipA family toxin n=1 Tax=Aliidiomarina minuta TaxID=880057 RepID=A0A432W9L7_9GAMM|nr:type II toxin-antitoxin system HipA family toxin [Aliidiomarina minuta]RUO26288.1 type II toxin-antitoxin system HipA family toxin [Aliidiomarina minuta]
MSVIKTVKEIKVGLNFGAGAAPVGRLAVRGRDIYFEYDRDFINQGLEISPLHLPLAPGLQTFEPGLFDGLPGVFNDSLPDGWGRLLFDRFARNQQLLPADITPLDRLAYVGLNGLGALVYEPDFSFDETSQAISLDRLAEQAQQVLQGEANDVLAELMALNGSSAGARPKALIGLNTASHHIIHGLDDLPQGYTPWMVKFANTQDGADAGAIEYIYAMMAKDAGIDIPAVRLFPARHGAGYFAIQRFDRDGLTRYHMHTACGLLHSDFRTPALDYEDLIALTSALTRDVREVEKMFRLAVFNVLAHNRDDHSKNFTFLMDKSGQWRLSPAYDLTFSSGPGSEQSTTVMGEGRNPGIPHLLELANEATIKKERAQEIIQRTQASLARWPELAKTYGVSHANIKLIESRLG